VSTRHPSRLVETPPAVPQLGDAITDDEHTAREEQRHIQVDGSGVLRWYEQAL